METENSPTSVILRILLAILVLPFVLMVQILGKLYVSFFLSKIWLALGSPIGNFSFGILQFFVILTCCQLISNSLKSNSKEDSVLSYMFDKSQKEEEIYKELAKKYKDQSKNRLITAIVSPPLLLLSVHLLLFLKSLLNL